MSHDQLRSGEEFNVIDRELPRVYLFGALPEGYEPDEEELDGQAD